ncbi:hypothetical protein D5270_09085 [Acutalibacter sp. 1XD8-36]|nr:hypothetical protein [Acutalibacter sp. 1XD8-36]
MDERKGKWESRFLIPNKSVQPPAMEAGRSPIREHLLTVSVLLILGQALYYIASNLRLAGATDSDAILCIAG